MGHSLLRLYLLVFSVELGEETNAAQLMDHRRTSFVVFDLYVRVEETALASSEKDSGKRERKPRGFGI